MKAKFLIGILILLLCISSCSFGGEPTESEPLEIPAPCPEIFRDEESGLYGIKKGDTVLVEAAYAGIEKNCDVFCAENPVEFRQALIYDEYSRPMIQNLPGTDYSLFDENGESFTDIVFDSVAISENADGKAYIQGCSNHIRYVWESTDEGLTLLSKEEPREEKLESGYTLFSSYWSWGQSKWGIKDPNGEIVLAPVFEKIEMPFDDRILFYDGASARHGWECGRCNLCGLNGIVLNQSYNVIQYSTFGDRYFGIGVSLGEIAEVICYDESGNVTPEGYWLLDASGNTVSERFDKIYIGENEGNLLASSPDDIITFCLGDAKAEKTVSDVLLPMY